MAPFHLPLFVLVYDLLDKNYSSSSTRGVSPVKSPVVNRCGIEAAILVLATFFLWETIFMAAFLSEDGGWRQLFNCP